MPRPIVQIQARLGSTRLPGKVLFHLGPKRVLGWVVERCWTAEQPDGLAVTTGDRPENEAITEWCDRSGVDYEVGPEDNLLERHRELATAMKADPVIRVTGDCPFVPSTEIDRLIRRHTSNDARYTTNVVQEMPIGTAVDIIDRDVLDELAELGDQHPVRRLRETPEHWDVVFSPVDQWTQFCDVHLAVDTPEDYWTLLDALEAVGSDPEAIAEWDGSEAI